MSGLHIIYGVMGAGKTNIVVNKYLDTQSAYKRIICNVPLTEEFKAKHSDWQFEIYPKLEPLQVINRISSDNPQTLFIVDESQLVLTSLNVNTCKLFAKALTQIRQDDQEVYLIAQTHKLLPNLIKDVATDCLECENQNIRGKNKNSKVKQYKGGYPYSTRLIDSFEFEHVYGNYATSNWEDSQPPKDLFFRQKIKLVFVILAFGALLLASFWMIRKVVYRHVPATSLTPEQQEVIETISEYKQSFFADGECYRSFTCNTNGICYYMNGYGQINIIPIAQMSSHKPCSISQSSQQSNSVINFGKN